MSWKPLSVQSQGFLEVGPTPQQVSDNTWSSCLNPQEGPEWGGGALPVHDHAVWNEDAVQISAVVGRVAEQVQTVAGPVVPELGGGPTPEPLLRCTSLTRLEKSHNFTVRTHRTEQKPGPPVCAKLPELSGPAIVSARPGSARPGSYHDAAAPPARLDRHSLHFGTCRTGRGRGGATSRTWKGELAEPRRWRGGLAPVAAGGRHGSGVGGEMWRKRGATPVLMPN